MSEPRYEAMQARRKPQRELVEGRWIAVRAPHHGTRSIYVHWLCECIACTAANTAYHVERQARLRLAVNDAA